MAAWLIIACLVGGMTWMFVILSIGLVRTVKVLNTEVESDESR